MNDLRRFSVADLVLLLVVVAAAAGARCWYLSVCCEQGASDGPYRVQDDWREEREALVGNIREHNQFLARAPLAGEEEQTAHTSFVYPWLLALLDRPANNLETTYQRMRWVQAALGALAAGLYFLFARRAFGRTGVALLAGLFCAVHPYWVVNVAEIADGVLASFLLAFALFLGARGGQVGGALTSLLYGLVLAGLACVRAALLPFAFIAVLWFLLRCQRLPRGWMYAFLAFLGFVIGVIPWLTRNYQAFHDVTPIVSSAYLHLWEGNNPRATGGPQDEQTMREALESEAEGRAAELRQMKQTERYRALAHEVVDEVRRNPGITLARRIRAGVGFFLGDRWVEDGSLVREDGAARGQTPDWLVRSSIGPFAGSLLFLLVLGAIGWRWSYAWRYEALPSSLAPFWVFLPYFLAHAEHFSGPRLPLDGLLLTYAALVLGCLVRPPQARAAPRY